MCRASCPRGHNRILYILMSSPHSKLIIELWTSVELIMMVCLNFVSIILT